MTKYTLFFIISIILSLASCVDRDFDEPDFNFEDPNIEVTTTIAALKSTHVNGQYETLSDGKVIAGVVVGNDRSGNFYQTIVIQDETGGIEIKIDKRSLFNLYPVGRKVYVLLDGLVMGDYNDLIQIGYSSTDDGFIGIPGENSEDYILAGSINNPVNPDTLTLSQIDANYMSTLVTLTGVQFADEELGKTYADGLYKETQNRILVDCAGKDIIVRSSGYASFANSTLPQGKGTFTAVLSRYRDDLQLYLRDTTDVVFDEMRCGTGTGNETVIDIISLRNAYNDGNTQIGDELKIAGTIISDRTHNNIYENNTVLQDASGGLVLRFSSAHQLELGDQVEVVVSALEMSDYNGLLQISNLPTAVASKQGNELLEPVEMTISEIYNEAEQLESTLVLIKGANISGGGTYSGNLDVSDGSGVITMYTRTQADFAGESVPSGNVDIVAIVSDFNGPQINLRSMDDVEGGNVNPGEDKFNKDFSDLDLKSGGWTTQKVIGDTDWEAYEYFDDRFGRISNFDGTTNNASDAWLISPETDLSTFDKPVLSYKTACNYSGPELEVYISESYDGTSIPNPGEWTLIEAPLSQGDWEWLSSGEIDLSAYQSSTIHVAFRYQGSDSEGKTWEVDDILLAEEQGGGGETSFEDDFEGGLANWYTYNVLGDEVWEHSTQYGNPGACAKMSGFNNGAFANEDWLISPALDLSSASAASFEFETAMNYTGNPLEVFLSDAYTGSGDPNDVTWEKIDPVLSGGSWSWTPSGTINLSSYLGSTVYFAFKFTSNDQESSTWEVDNVKVTIED